jgi:pyruvate dehydrogenase E1 component beta subunit
MSAVERRLTVGAALHEALDVALALDPSVVLLGEDVASAAGGRFGITRGLAERHGAERVRSTPISEQAILGAALGAALGGRRPVAEIMLADFLAVGLDQLANQAAKVRYLSGGRVGAPMVVRLPSGGPPGAGAHHAQHLEAWLAHTPGLKVVAPSTPGDAKGLLLSAVFDDDPVVVVEPVLLYDDEAVAAEVPEGDLRTLIGKAAVKRAGKDITVVAWGRPVHAALAAAAVLQDDGIEVEVLDLRTLVPLDEEALFASITKTKNAVVVHDAVGRSGFGAEVSARVHEELFSELERPVQRVAAPATPVPYAPALAAAHLPTAAQVEAAVRAIVA